MFPPVRHKSRNKREEWQYLGQRSMFKSSIVIELACFIPRFRIRPTNPKRSINRRKCDTANCFIIYNPRYTIVDDTTGKRKMMLTIPFCHKAMMDIINHVLL